MPEPRNKQALANIEEVFYKALFSVCSVNKISISDYIRSLIIEDLAKKGEINDKTIKQALIGHGCK